MMLVAARHLFQVGYSVTLYQNCLEELQSWFPFCSFQSQSRLLVDTSDLSTYDFLLLQHSNRSFIESIIAKSRANHLPEAAVFYSAYDPKRHFSLGKKDVIFDGAKSIVENISFACHALFPKIPPSLDNGISPPIQIKKGKETKVLIHPVSSALEKDWGNQRFCSLQDKLLSLGVSSAFCMHPKERDQWVKNGGPKEGVICTPTLNDLGSLLCQSHLVIGNDSGIGHFSSNLGIRTVTIGKCYRHMQLWRPGWKRGTIITPNKWIPNMKMFRFREKHWQSLISLSRVEKQVKKELQKVSASL